MFIFSGAKRLATMILMVTVVSISAACGAVPSSKGQATVQVDPEQVQKMEYLNQTADDMYKKTMEGQVTEARSKLLQISDQIPKIRFEGAVSVEGLNALTETITQAKRVYNAVSYSPEEGQLAVAKIRLATDALTHKNQPMWLQYYKVLQNDIALLRQAVKANQQQEAVAGFGKLSQHIAVIRPSILISREPADVEKLDSLLTFLHSKLNSSPMQTRQMESVVEQLQQMIDELFMKHKDAMAFVPLTDPRQPIIWSIGIGLIIISVLSYAGWRMYQSGKHVVSVKQTKEGEHF
ncbi:sporulation protein YpjB [Paenibacillus sp. GCM10027628]|uniref:sporulation protein YpjB n=1 Tax=Paenibacillus sp. GCM10027628 TaxID=3273413 RepID=UPI003630D92E